MKSKDVTFAIAVTLGVLVLCLVLWLGYLTRPGQADEVPPPPSVLKPSDPPLDPYQRARQGRSLLPSPPIAKKQQQALYVLNSKPQMVLDLDEVQAVILGDNDFHVYFKGRALTLNVVGNPQKFLRAWRDRRKQ